MLPEAYITVLSLVTTPSVYIAVRRLCGEFTDDRRHQSLKPAAAEPLLKLSNRLEVSLSSHKLREPPCRVTCRTAEVRVKPRQLCGVVLPFFVTLRTDEPDERFDHVLVYTPSH